MVGWRAELSRKKVGEGLFLTLRAFLQVVQSRAGCGIYYGIVTQKMGERKRVTNNYGVVAAIYARHWAQPSRPPGPSASPPPPHPEPNPVEDWVVNLQTLNRSFHWT